MIARLRRRLRSDAGFTLTEMMVVIAVLSLVIGALVAIFVSGIRAQRDSVDRLIAQQEARIAVDRLRREVHCANDVTLDTTGDDEINLQFPQVNGNDVCGFGTSVVWKAQPVMGFASRFELTRNGVRVADHITQGNNIFATAPPSATELGRLTVNLPVNPRPADTEIAWTLEGDIVLRNTQRSTP